jgi:hypothetical protein
MTRKFWVRTKTKLRPGDTFVTHDVSGYFIVIKCTGIDTYRVVKSTYRPEVKVIEVEEVWK